MSDYNRAQDLKATIALKLKEEGPKLYTRLCSCLEEKLGEAWVFVVKTQEACLDGDRVSVQFGREVFRELYLVVQKVKIFVDDCCYDNKVEEAFVFAAIRVTAHKERFLQYYVELAWCIHLLECIRDAKYGKRVDCQTLQQFGWEKLRSSVDTEVIEAGEKDLMGMLRSRISNPGQHRAICAALLRRFEVQTDPDSPTMPDPNLGVPRRFFKNQCSLRNLVGKGGSGIVFRIKWKKKPFAVKVLEICDGEKSDTEVKILGDCCHPHIVNLILAHKEDKHQYIMMELLSMHLLSYIEKRKEEKTFPFPALEVVDMILQVCEGMLYIHKKKVSHRDLKPSNILVKLVEGNPDYKELQLADFGQSKERLGNYSTSQNTPNVGTTVYRAPELTQKGCESRWIPVSSMKADMYSFALTCSYLLTGTERLIEEVRLNKMPNLPKDCPQALATLLRRCWHPKPAERPEDFNEIRTELRKLKANLLSDVLTSIVGKGDPAETSIAGATRNTEHQKQPGTGAAEESDGTVKFNPGDRRLNILVLGDSGLVETVVSHIRGAGRLHTEVQNHVKYLTESRNSQPPMCLYGDTQGINGNHFAHIKTLVNMRNRSWHRKQVQALWLESLDEVNGERLTGLFPLDSASRLHIVWFVCSEASGLPNYCFKWPAISKKLDGLPVQILVIGKQGTKDLDLKYNQIFDYRSHYFKNAKKLDELIVKEELIVKVALGDGDLKEKLWRICWAAKTRVEIENAAKIIRTIRKQIGPAGISISVGVGGATIPEEASLSQSGQFVLTFLCTYWDVPIESILSVLHKMKTFVQETTTSDQERTYTISIKRCEFVKFSLQVAAIILSYASAHRPDYDYNWNFTSESSSQVLLEAAQRCYESYFKRSISQSDYDKMRFEDIREFLQSIFERKDSPLASDVDRKSTISKVVNRFSRSR